MLAFHQYERCGFIDSIASPPTKFSSGFGGRPNDDEESMYGGRSPPSGTASRGGGAAIGKYLVRSCKMKAVKFLKFKESLLLLFFLNCM